MTTRSSRSVNRGVTSRLIVRVALLAILWWALNGDDTGSWWVGAPAIVAAALGSVALSRGNEARPSFSGILRFAPFFLRQSLVGGIDVALRAMRPSLPLAPAFVSHRLGLPAGPATAVMAATVSLLPGTLAAEISGQDLRVHTLIEGPAVEEELRELEGRVAVLFGREAQPPAVSPGQEARP